MFLDSRLIYLIFARGEHCRYFMIEVVYILVIHVLLMRLIQV